MGFKKLGLASVAALGSVAFITSCNPTPKQTDKVTSVSVVGSYVGLSEIGYKFAANVKGTGSFSTEVEWSVDDKDASITQQGVLTYKGGVVAGEYKTLTVTATSTADRSIKGTSEITMVANNATKQNIIDMAETSETDFLPTYGTEAITSTVSDDSFVLDWKGNERKITKATFKVVHDETAKPKYQARVTIEAEKYATKTLTVDTSVMLADEFKRLEEEARVTPTYFKYSDIRMFSDDIYGYYVNETVDQKPTYTYITYKQGLLLDYVNIINDVIVTNLHILPNYPVM